MYKVPYSPPLGGGGIFSSCRQVGKDFKIGVTTHRERKGEGRRKKEKGWGREGKKKRDRMGKGGEKEKGRNGKGKGMGKRRIDEGNKWGRDGMGKGMNGE